MTDKNKFEHLGLSKRVLDAIYKKGFEEPSRIQALTIPVMLRNDINIIAQAQTGTGKTAAFGLPLIEMINPSERSVHALIITPTRELAIQVSEEISSFKGNSGIQVIPIYGGQSIDQQLRRLKKGVHIVVGTPGRVIDHIKRKTLNLKDVEYLILDEADEMLNMGFIEDMEEIMSHTNPHKRILLFSATMPLRIKALASKYMGDYEFITVKKQQLTTSLTEQIYYEVKAGDKFEALCRIIDIEEDFYGLVFCRTKNDVDSIVSHLIDRGYDADAIHGDISQAQREKTLDKFKKKRINVLVATDVAARGIDVNNLTHVINYSLPHDPESYVNRIGRTGRAGKQGTAITFITPSEYNKLMFIKRIAKTDIKKSRVPNVKDIVKAKKKKINEDITAINSEEIDNTYYNWAKKLLDDNNSTQILAKLLSYCFDNELNPGLYNEIKDLSGKNRRIEMEGRTRLFVALGKKDKISPSKLVKFIIKNTGVKNSAIDQVEVYNNFSFVTVPFKEAEIILGVFQKKSGKKKSLVVKAKKKQIK
ncbi:DEAD-box ATP-dependent RNA helicase CshA [subsurface metagenome]|nr:DEAD/DEAH box helicase [Clostridia bacterium]